MIRLHSHSALFALACMFLLTAAPLCAADGTLMVTETEVTEPAYEIPSGDVTPERYIRPEWLKSVEKPHANYEWLFEFRRDLPNQRTDAAAD